jgi:hypothetical protein
MEPIPPQPIPGTPPNKQNRQNFVDEVAVVTEERRTALWKTLILETTAVIFAGCFGYCFALYLVALASFWPVLITLLLWSAAEVIVDFLEKNGTRRWLFAALESAALVIFFHTYPLAALIAAAVISFLLLTWGYYSVRRELRNTVQIRFFTASGKAVGKVVTAAVVFIVIMYASLTTGTGNFFVSPAGFTEIFNWGSKVVDYFYPTIPFGGSFGDFAQAIARVELEGNSQFQNLTPSEQNLALSQSANDIVSSFASSTAPNTAIASSTPTQNAFYDYLAGLSAQLQDRFDGWFAEAWGLVFFLILRGIGVIVVWIGQLVAMIFYEILLAAGFMKIREESTTKETVDY